MADGRSGDVRADEKGEIGRIALVLCLSADRATDSRIPVRYAGQTTGRYLGLLQGLVPALWAGMKPQQAI